MTRINPTLKASNAYSVVLYKNTTKALVTKGVFSHLVDAHEYALNYTRDKDFEWDDEYSVWYSARLNETVSLHTVPYYRRP